MQTFEGKVVSVKTPQTVAVEITYQFKHPQYGKIINRTTKLLVHNEIEGVKEGDLVRLVKSRPYSKNKHFLLTEVLAKGSVENKKEVEKPVLKEPTNPKAAETKKKGSAKPALPAGRSARKSA